MRTLVQRVKALADATRLRLLALLVPGELCVCQLEAALGLSQVNVSRHLAILRHAGIVQDRREGRWVYYTFAEPMDADTRALIDAALRPLRDDPAVRTDLARAEEVRCLPVGATPSRHPRIRGGRDGRRVPQGAA